MKDTKRSNRWFVVVTIFIGAAVIAYLSVYGYFAMKNGIATAPVIIATSYDSAPLTGLFVRDEEILAGGSDGGFVYITAEEGKRVSRGDTLAQSYISKDAWVSSVRAHEVEAQILALRTLMDERGNISESRLDSTIDSSLDKLRSAVKDKNYQIASDAAYGLLELAENAANSAEALTRLQAERATISKVSYSSVYAQTSALFSKYVDGFVDSPLINVGTINTLDSQTLDALIKVEPEPSASALGKIVYGQKWYYVTNVSQSLSRQLLPIVGKRVRMLFPTYGEFSMTVEHVGEFSDSGGRSVVVFSCSRQLQRLLTVRKSDAELVISEYTGLRVPREAVKLEMRNSKSVEAETCVYVVEGPYMIRKFVEIIKDDGDFYILKNDVYTETALHEGDDVIVSGTNLYNRKVIGS